MGFDPFSEIPYQIEEGVTASVGGVPMISEIQGIGVAVGT